MPEPLWIVLVEAFTVAGGVFFGCLKLFEKLESYAGPELKAIIAKWLQRTRDRSVDCTALPRQSLLLFDQVFGKKHWSWRRFGLSAAISVVTFSIFFFGYLTWLAFPRWFSVDEANLRIIFLVFILVMVLNVIPDFLSLQKTRWLLGILVRSPQSFLIFLGVGVADVVLTLILFSIIPLVVLMASGNTQSDVVPTLISLFTLNLDCCRTTALLGAAILTTFTTSIWVLLYVLGAGSARLFSGFRWFAHYTAIEERPLGSIGLALGLALASFYLFVFGLYSMILWILLISS